MQISVMDCERECEANHSPINVEEHNSDHVYSCLSPSEAEKGYCTYSSECIDGLDEDKIKKMTFDSEEEARKFYNFYAKCVGFSIRKDNVQRSESGEINCMRRWVCSKEGFRAEKWIKREDKKREPRPLTRCGCSASFRVKYNKKLKKYLVTDFQKAHNHELMEQEGVTFLPSHRSIEQYNLKEARSMQEVGWRTSEIMKFFAHRSGGYHNVGFIPKDLYNHLDAERRAEIRDGDAEGALAYLSAKKDTDPLFFFKYEVDESNRLSRMFWSDSKCQSDYKDFGDVLVFDTTYRTNAYRKPLVILAGVNNHYMTTIFAAALLSDETEATYVWVLETFIAAMGKKKPISVITDGDNAMRLAIEKVLPDARHRLCSWHLQRNAAVHVHSACFCRAFHRCMEKVCTKEEFERKWKDFVHEHQVENNSWVNEVHSKREKWAEAYLRGHFFGNMKCTQRCEGMNAFLKKHVNVKMRFYEFVRSFDLALAWLRYMEDKANSITLNSIPVPSTHLKDIETHAANLLTRNMFFMIREEIRKEVVILSRIEHELGSTRIYSLHEYSKPHLKTTVKYDSHSLLFECSCLHLETVGWPCVHMFAVMKAEHMKEIPPTCVLTRWTRNAKGNDHNERGPGIPTNVTQNARYGALVSRCNKMCYQASFCDEGYGEMCDIITQTSKKINVIYEKFVASGGHNGGDNNASQNSNNIHFGVRDPVISKTKGSGGLDSKCRPRRCSKCGFPGHNKTTCPKYNSQRDGESSQMNDYTSWDNDSQQLGGSC